MPSYAQTIRGRTVEAATGKPLEGVEINIFASDHQLGRAFSDSFGSFQFLTTGAGTYSLRAVLIGYAVLDSIHVVLGAREMVELTLKMSAAAVALQPIIVNARRADPRHLATYDGFYTRRSLARPIGPSRVVLRSDPEMINAIYVKDVLDWFPRPNCLAYYVNGRLTEDYENISVSLLEGLEFYRDFVDAPLELRGENSHCARNGRGPTWSVLALWLQRSTN